MSSNPQAPKSDPSIRPTSISVLIVAALAAAALGWLLFSSTYPALPELPWSPVLVLGVLAVAEGVLAQNTAARIQRKPGTVPADPLAVARYVALAKASSLVGALYAGFSVGLAAWLALDLGNQAHKTDLPPALGGLVASLALIAAALWLEHACRIPKRPDDTGTDDSDLSSHRY